MAVKQLPLLPSVHQVQVMAPMKATFVNLISCFNSDCSVWRSPSAGFSTTYLVDQKKKILTGLYLPKPFLLKGNPLALCCDDTVAKVSTGLGKNNTWVRSLGGSGSDELCVCLGDSIWWFVSVSQSMDDLVTSQGEPCLPPSVSWMIDPCNPAENKQGWLDVRSQSQQPEQRNVRGKATVPAPPGTT